MDPDHVQVRPRGPAVRGCTFCHGEIGERDPVAFCPSCQTTLHTDCRAGLERCPTMGCQGITRKKPGTEPLVARPPDVLRGGYAELGAARVGPVVGALAGAGLYLATRSTGHAFAMHGAEVAFMVGWCAGWGAFVGAWAGAGVGFAIDLVGVRRVPSRGALLLPALVLGAGLLAALLAGRSPIHAVAFGLAVASLTLVIGLRALGSPLRR